MGPHVLCNQPPNPPVAPKAAFWILGVWGAKLLRCCRVTEMGVGNQMPALELLRSCGACLQGIASHGMVNWGGRRGADTSLLPSQSHNKSR